MLYELIYLIRCALDGVQPEIHDIDFEKLFSEAKEHQVLCMVAFALESAGLKIDAFSKEKEEALMRLLMMEIERKAIFQEFDREKIWHMPLKGIILKDYYPKAEWRQMADNDILFDADRAEDVRKIMEGLGFETVRFGGGREDDNYQKKPSSNFEMHRTLFNPQDVIVRRFLEYYSDIKDRLICIGGCEYRFRPEDFYIHFIAHEYKHYACGGTGLKALVDTYILLKKFEKSYSWDYINQELVKLNLLDFEQENRSLVKSIFNGENLTELQAERLDYMFESGAYGIKEHTIQNLIRRIGKPRYMLSSIFLPMDVIRKKYPFFYNHKIALPLLPFYRLTHNKALAKRILGMLFDHI